MKIVFLDFDGVLNGLETREPPSPIHAGLFLNPALVERVNGICEHTGAVVVLSTSWRYRTDETGCSVDVCEALRLAGFRGRVIGQTPDMRPVGQLRTYTPRSDEIRAWLASHACDAFVTLDDHGDADVDGCGIRTDTRRGITDADADAALRILRGEK